MTTKKEKEKNNEYMRMYYKKKVGDHNILHAQISNLIRNGEIKI